MAKHYSLAFWTLRKFLVFLALKETFNKFALDSEDVHLIPWNFLDMNARVSNVYSLLF